MGLESTGFNSTWVSSTDGGVYSIDAVVVFGGDLYRNLTGTNSDANPSDDTTNWRLVASRGVTLARGEALQSVSSVSLGTVNTVVTGASIVLPGSGTYRLFYNARAAVAGISEFVVFRMFDVTGNDEVPNTLGICEFDTGSAGNKQSTVSVEQPEFTVTAATTIRLEGRSNATGNTSNSDGNGITKIGFSQLPETIAVTTSAPVVGGTVTTDSSQKPAQNVSTAIEFDTDISMVGIPFSPNANQTLFVMPSAGRLFGVANFHFERVSSGGLVDFWMWLEKDVAGNGVFESISYGRHKPLATNEHDVSVITLNNIAVNQGDRVRVMMRTNGGLSDGVGLLQGAPPFMSPAQVVGCALNIELRASIDVRTLLPFTDEVTVNVVLDGTVTAGDVLTFSAATPGRVIRTTTASNERVLGVSLDNGVVGNTIRMVVGNEFSVTVNNTVAVGNFLESSSVAGRAQSSGTEGGPGDFAVAMTAGVAGGTVQARYMKSEVF